MYISTTLLNNAWNKHKNNRENYDNLTKSDSASAGASAAFDSFFIVMASIFFVLELVLVVYSVIIAINCTKGGAERIVHIVLSITFTLPYILIMSVFNKCAQSTLSGESVNTSTYRFGTGGCTACSINKV